MDTTHTGAAPGTDLAALEKPVVVLLFADFGRDLGFGALPTDAVGSIRLCTELTELPCAEQASPLTRLLQEPHHASVVCTRLNPSVGFRGECQC